MEILFGLCLTAIHLNKYNTIIIHTKMTPKSYNQMVLHFYSIFMRHGGLSQGDWISELFTSGYTDRLSTPQTEYINMDKPSIMSPVCFWRPRFLSFEAHGAMAVAILAVSNSELTNMNNTKKKGAVPIYWRCLRQPDYSILFSIGIDCLCHPASRWW